MNRSSAEDLLQSRRSVRGFLPDLVPQDDIERILRATRMAPSGANLQPGRFHVLTQQPLVDLTQSLSDAAKSGRPPVSEYSYFPQPMSAELKAKQRAAGYALYSALGIGRRDVAARKAQFIENYRFFSAPVGIVVTIQRDMGKGCFMDLGIAMMSLIIMARDLGYATCGIGALANYADVAHAHLGLDANEMVVCGMALGVADPVAPVNAVETERDPLEAYATFQGFS